MPHQDPRVDRLEQEFEAFQRVQEEQQQTTKTLANALERLSLVVVGDDELRIVGYNKRLETVEAAQRRDQIAKLKVVWFTTGAAFIAGGLFKLGYYLVSIWFTR